MSPGTQTRGANRGRTEQRLREQNSKKNTMSHGGKRGGGAAHVRPGAMLVKEGLLNTTPWRGNLRKDS